MNDLYKSLYKMFIKRHVTVSNKSGPFGAGTRTKAEKPIKNRRTPERHVRPSATDLHLSTYLLLLYQYIMNFVHVAYSFSYKL